MEVVPQQATQMPPGVTPVAQPGAAPIVQPPVAQMPPAMPIDTPAPEKWNWLLIGAGVALGVTLCYSIYYFRYKTRVYPEKMKEQDQKIAAVQADITAIKNPPQS